MAHIPVHRLDARALTRIGRIYQVKALAPFPERHEANYWDSRADRFRHLMPAAIGGDLGAVYMQIPELDETPGAPVRFRPPASTRSPNVSGTVRGIPDQLCYALTVRNMNIHPFPGNVSSPPIPWPFRIVGASFNFSGSGPSLGTAWGLTLTDEDYSNENTEPLGTPLIVQIADDAPIGGLDGESQRTTPVLVHTGDASYNNAQAFLASQLIGIVVPESGKRLTLTVASDAAATEVAVLVLTLQALAAERAAAIFTPAAQRAPSPPPISRRTGTTFKPPTPPIAPSGCNPALMTPLERLQLERNGETWFRQRHPLHIACGGPGPLFAVAPQTTPTSAPSLAVALQAIAEGRAPVTVPFRVGPGDTAIAAGQIQFESLRQIEARKAIERASAGPLVPVTGPLGGG